MSHFVHLVLVPKDETKPEDFETFIAKQLAPYDENTDMPEYETDCHCVGDVAARESREMMESKHGSFGDLRKKVQAEMQERFGDRVTYPQHNDASGQCMEEYEEDDARRQEYWTEHVTPYINCRDWLTKNSPKINLPDPTCGFYSEDYCPEGETIGARFDDGSACGGTGRVMSTYNPKSKWDWYVVGGRWDGWIQGENHNKDADWERVYRDEARQVMNNVISSEILKKQFHKREFKHLAHSATLLDGSWIQNGEMGWFGCNSEETTEGAWAEILIEALDKAGDCWVVACDLHI